MVSGRFATRHPINGSERSIVRFFMFSKLIFQLVLAVIPIYVLIESSGYKAGSFDNSGGAALFPTGIAWFMLGLTLIQIVRTVVRGVQSSQGEQQDDDTKVDKPVVFWSLFWGVPGVVLLVSIAYAILIPVLGFMLASSLFLVSSGAFLMYKADGRIDVKTMLMRSAVFIAFAVGIFQLFMRGMRIYLPTGVFGF